MFMRRILKLISFHVKAKDISSLDVYSDDVAINEWGGLTQFSSKANEVVSKYMAQYGE